MAVRTEEELTNRLDGDIAWRKHELANLSAVLGSVQDSQQAMLVRGAICMLYAHWEGFIKTAASLYLEFVGRRGIKYQNLNRNFWAIGLKSLLNSAGQAKRTSIHLEIINTILSYSNNSFKTPAPDTIDTSSNLNSHVLTEILTAIGFDETDYMKHRVMLDERLLRNRNSIAHGDQLSVATDAYIELHDIVIGLMDRFKNDIQDAAATKGYRVS
ncbi:MAG: MAE_28990/MAE_18760 family HEPN-like nuclease [Chloroflexi bacterium]|nr:MAE_28990/MAE_18760 family HEPN-like nuclease [Chloroflexota bacterium]